jgi:hypothetical protein
MLYLEMKDKGWVEEVLLKLRQIKSKKEGDFENGKSFLG